MPAPFLNELFGFRSNGLPNTSDKGDDQSKELGLAMLDSLGATPDRLGPSDPGTLVEERIAAHLSELRPDLDVRRSRAAGDFEQYRHLRVFQTFWKTVKKAPMSSEKLDLLIGRVEARGLRNQLVRASGR